VFKTIAISSIIFDNFNFNSWVDEGLGLFCFCRYIGRNAKKNPMGPMTNIDSKNKRTSIKRSQLIFFLKAMTRGIEMSIGANKIISIFIFPFSSYFTLSKIEFQQKNKSVPSKTASTN
jgi:hypothetical protein